ncbi:MAG: hypothetical protein KDC12_10090 [Flavobacteriales bacterium]|nr:hypothetical protein [Flavobacteriales bacterium]
MLTGLQHTHNFLRWIIIIMMIWSVIEIIKGRREGARFEGQARKAFLFTLIAIHVQVLIGLGLYFSSEVVKMALNSSEMMSNSFLRFWAIEHIFGMVLAAVLITIGWSRAKRATDDRVKFKRIAFNYILGFIIILATIPWPFREMFSHYSWFPGM